MHQVSNALNISEEKLTDLNPSYVHKIIPVVEGQKNYIYIPDTLSSKFLNMNKIFMS